MTRPEQLQMMKGYGDCNEDYWKICDKCPCGEIITIPNTNPVLECFSLHAIKCENCNPDKDLIWYEREFQSEKILKVFS